MSLNVYLKMPGAKRRPGSGIFIREGGQTREISREDWDKRFPGREPVIVGNNAAVDLASSEEGIIYTANITHNLVPMANAAGVFLQLWRPETIGIKEARQLIWPLRDAIARLQTNPEHFWQFNPANGWGSYNVLVTFIRDYLQACEQFPDATVSVSR